MIYTIMYARSTKNSSIQIDFEKNGNMFVVSIWHRGEFRTLRKHETAKYDKAAETFKAWCDEFSMNTVKEVTQDWDATDFD